MEKYVVGTKKILKKEQVLISMFFIAILVLSSGSMVAFAKNNAYVVKPNGSNDTADIQAALNSCVGAGPWCTVQLVAGTYYISQIAVTGFQGKFVGMGQGVTIVQALPNLPSPTANPYWTALPGPSNPWPNLFTFVGGSIYISGMTINEPYTKALPYGFNSPAFGPTNSLEAAILVTGQQAKAAIDHVTVLGTSGDCDGTNVFWAIQFAGWLLPSAYTDPLADTILLSGTFSVADSTFNSVNSAVWSMFLTDSYVTVSNNKITNTPVGLSVLDVSNSKLSYFNNQATDSDYQEGIQVLQSIFRTDLSPITVYITGNTFMESGGAVGVALWDNGAAKTLNAVVTGNVVRTDTSCGCYDPTSPWYYSAIDEIAPPESIIATGNTIIGGGAAGIYVTGGPGQVVGNIITGAHDGVWVDSANNVHVVANIVKNNVQWGIAVTDGSSNNVITGNFLHGNGAYDLYWDNTGTGNVWCHNIFQTSNPSVLPSC